MGGGDGDERVHRAGDGGDLLRIPDVGRAVLLERPARRRGLGSSRLLDDRLVCYTSYRGKLFVLNELLQ